MTDDELNIEIEQLKAELVKLTEELAVRNDAMQVLLDQRTYFLGELTNLAVEHKRILRELK